MYYDTPEDYILYFYRIPEEEQIELLRSMMDDLRHAKSKLRQAANMLSGFDVNFRI